MSSLKKFPKITNEKPISLYGVDFKKLLAAFLQVKPDKEKAQNKETKKPHSE